MFNIENFIHDDALPAAEKWYNFPIYNFVGGHNDENFVPIEKLQDVSKKVLSKYGKTLGKYNNYGPLGFLPLRKSISKNLKKSAGIICDEDEILIVSGSLQALDLVNATFLRFGDTVILEEGSYGGVFSRFKRLGINIIGIPLEDDGLNTEILEKRLNELSIEKITPRFIYTIPTIQNPTGTIMSLKKRLKLIDIAKKYDIPIFEDDCYADLIWELERPKSIYSLDTTNRVIYCGSFSKTIAPGLRLGYLVADWSVLSRILPYKTDGGTGGFEQMVIHEFCEKYFYDHLNKLNKNLREKSLVMSLALDKYFGNLITFKKPLGGIYIWVEFSKIVNTYKLYELASKEGILINPGVEWSLDSKNNNKIRLCFANPNIKIIDDGIKKLAHICKKEFGVPKYIANQN